MMPEYSDPAETPPAKSQPGKPSRLVLWIAGVVALIGAYAAFGFLAAPRLMHDTVVGQIEKITHRKPSLGKISLNPFSLHLAADNFSLPDRDGKPMVAFKRLDVTVAWDSVWRLQPVFTDITLDDPRVALVRRPDGKLNLTDLVPPADPKADRTKPASPLKLEVKSLVLRRGVASIADLGQPEPFAKTLTPVSFSLKDFSTVKDGASYAFNAVTEKGETLTWRGTFGLTPLRSQGGFTLGRIKVAPLAVMAKAALPFDVASGDLDVTGTYRFALRDKTLDLKLDLSRVVLDNAALRARGVGQDWVNLGRVEAAAIAVDVPASHVSVAHLVSTGASVNAWLEKGGVINLARLAPLPPKTAAAQPVAKGTPWTVDLPDVQVKAARVDFEDRTIPRPLHLGVTPIDIRVTGAGFPLSKPVDIEASAELEEGGKVVIKGQLGLNPVSADINLESSHIDLTTFQPYVREAANLKLVSGELSSSGRVVLSPKGQLTYAGGARVDDLHTTDQVLDQDLVNWRSLDARGVDFSARPLKVNIKEIRAQAPYARVVIEPNYVVNITTALPSQPGQTPTTAPGSPLPVSASKVREGPTVQQGQTVQQGPAVQQGKATLDFRKVPKPPKKTAAEPSPAHAPLPVEIGVVKIADGRMDFTDLTVTPHFSAGIQSLAGTIKGLSGKQDSRAVIDLKGAVDRYAPVDISGKVNYFAARSFTDVRMNFQNMELTTFSPYSGKFAGYRIEKGKLNVDLHYLINDQKLDATHHVVIDQLQLGEKVDSADAVKLPVKLPVKLIIALLKDKNGVIDLPIDVSGSLDDPKFQVWPVIWKVVGNLFDKIVSAPFTLLGKLVGGGGGEELSFIDFSPGSAALTPEASKKLETLAKALIDRPALSLEVPLTAQPDLDRPVMAKALFEQKLEAAATAFAGRKKPGSSAPANLLAAPRSRHLVLDRLYLSEFGKKPVLPKPAAQTTAGQPKPDPEQLACDYLEAQVKSHITVSDAELGKLARDRAESVQGALLSGGAIAPSRLFVVVQKKPASDVTTGRVRMEFDLK